MNQDIVVKLDDVSESYHVDFIRDGKIKHEELLVIDKISLTVTRGECLAILGANGAGKSTTLKLIAGILKPDSGELRINGRVACLLDLGAGFDPNATGRENIFILAELYGIPKKQIQHKLEQIIEFSGIGKFIDAPLKCYSAGMYVRLAFSLAINVEPDILLIDDCLVVGDDNFQKKCIEKIFELKRGSKTIIFVTHDTNLAAMIANRGIFLKDGRILYDGSIEKAFVYYTQMVGDMSGIGIIDNGPASIIFNNGKLYLNWKDMPLSKSFGGYANMQMQGRQLFSKDMHWKIESMDARSLVAAGQDISRSISQVWKIKLNDDNSIDWQINTESLADIGFSLSRISLMLNERFSKWSTLADHGEFPLKYSSYGEWEVLESVKSNFNTDSLICAYYDENPGTGAALGVLLEADKDDSFRIPQAMISGVEQSSKIISLAAPELDRQNAFSGKIMVFDNKQKLQSYLDYKKLKSVQERQIQSGDTRLFFDQGRLRLFYKGLELTKSNCFFSSFYSGQKWFNSSEAAWDFKKQDSNTLILKARWPGLKLSQIWQISLLNENEIVWGIGIEVKEGIDILSFRNVVFLSNQYSEWFSTYEEGLFPENYAWQDMVLVNNKRRTVGIKNKGDYPGLSLDVSEDLNTSLPSIQNTDLIHESRALYTSSLPSRKAAAVTYREGYHDYFLAKLKIFPEAGAIEEYILANSKIKLEEELDEELAIQANLLQASTIQDGVTKIIFDSDSMRIFYKELELTDSCGLRTIFDVADIKKQLNSENARRKIDKVAKNRIICHFRWDDLSCISQKWDVSIEDNTIHLLVTMSSFDRVDIYNERTGIQISNNYKQLKLADAQMVEINYDFPGDFRGIPIRNNKSRFVFAQKHEEQGTVYPELLFKSLATDNPETISITLDKKRGSGIFFIKIKDDPDVDVTPGEYVFFKGSIALGCAAGDMDLSSYPARYDVGCSTADPLGVYFDNGKARLFWKGREITAGLGLYTSFCSNRQWYDSSQAFWKINHAGSGSIELRGSWPWIPVIQHWQIKRYKNGIFLDIDNQVYREFSLDAQEFNLLLIQEYRRWFVGDKSGCFYDEFSHDDLLRFRVWVSKTGNKKIGVKRMLFRLPSVSLTSLNSSDNRYFIIENANILGEKGRLIQHLETYRNDNCIIKPCKYNFFQGKIDLNKI